jgi:hypothetical protein
MKSPLTRSLLQTNTDKPACRQTGKNAMPYMTTDK